MRASKTRLVLVLLLIVKKVVRAFLSQSGSEVEQNQSKHDTTFDTNLKNALSHQLSIATHGTTCFR